MSKLKPVFKKMKTSVKKLYMCQTEEEQFSFPSIYENEIICSSIKKVSFFSEKSYKKETA